MPDYKYSYIRLFGIKIQEEYRIFFIYFMLILGTLILSRVYKSDKVYNARGL
jgi:hypothetical protein